MINYQDALCYIILNLTCGFNEGHGGNFAMNKNISIKE